MASAVTFRRAALDDIVRYESWRTQQNPSWRPIGPDLIDAIVQAANQHSTFEAIPAPLLAVRGQVALLKRVLVPVRSKIFRVYVGRGRAYGTISVRRVLHPHVERSREGEDHPEHVNSLIVHAGRLRQSLRCLFSQGGPRAVRPRPAALWDCGARQTPPRSRPPTPGGSCTR